MNEQPGSGDHASASPAPETAASAVLGAAPELPPTVPAVETAAAAIDCWRCGKALPAADTTCPTCRAPVERGGPPPSIERTEPGERLPSLHHLEVAGARNRSKTPPIVTVVYYFMALLGVSIIGAVVGGAILGDEGLDDDPGAHHRQLIVLCEVIDSVLVAVAWWRIPRPASVAAGPRWRRLAGWCAAGPILLAAALAANVGYHRVLRDYLAVPEWLATVDESIAGASVVWLALAICLQPAVIEEIFFRYLVLGHMRGVMGVHGAVWVSSLMFALAHLGVPLSVPMLLIVGVALGYARVASGSLLLPMLMHAAHNAVVVYLEISA